MTIVVVTFSMLQFAFVVARFTFFSF